jgi:3-hydroxyacyl-CoA dehydrogenase
MVIHFFDDPQKSRRKEPIALERDRMSILIRKAAVLGAGVMGSGIAAHLANAGIPCLLLDIVPPKAAEGEDTSSRAFRDKFARSALVNLQKAKPAPLFSKSVLPFIEVGNFEDDMGRLSECDWVVEAVKEDLGVKQALFAKVEAAVRPGTVVSSNTSGLSVASMLEGRGEDFRKHFIVTHFFNPVRYMKLLELVKGPETKREVVLAMHKFGEEVLGKGIVYGKDTTNFIANRIGVYGMMKTMEEMLQAEMTVEEVDRVFGPAMGRPKSAVFRTADIVGLDTFMHVAQNCFDTLPNDEERAIFASPEFMSQMVKAGMLGAKSGKGFYTKTKDGILSLDLNTLEYKAQKDVKFESIGAARKAKTVGEKIATVMKGDDKAARFAEKVTLSVLAYSSRRLPEIADDIVNIDRGLRWGFGWDLGPFETWDAIGVRYGLERMKALGIEPAPWVNQMVEDGAETFYNALSSYNTYYDVEARQPILIPQSKRALTFDSVRREGRKLKTTFSATLWDMKDDVLLVEFHSKMNAIDDDIIDLMHDAVDIAERDFAGIVIANDGGNFSAGANIMALLMGAKSGQFDQIDRMISRFQKANQRMRYSRVPVVTAPYGLTLGGGAEVTMGGNAIQAAAETYIGLVEFGVGLIPGGGGNLQLLRNIYAPFAADPDFDPFPFIKKAFLSIGMAKVATSAEEAREAGFFSASDGVSMNRDLQLSDAKARAIGMANAGFTPPRPTQFLLPGRSGKATIDMLLYDMLLNRQISEHDRLIGSKLASVLTGGDCSPSAVVTEDYLLELEREHFLSLCGEEKTQDRLAHMLQFGKPLRN